MPVHPHDGAERLKPEGMREPAQQLVATVVVDNCLNDDPAERSHPRDEPWRYIAAVQRQISAAGSVCHDLVSATSTPHVKRSRWLWSTAPTSASANGCAANAMGPTAAAQVPARPTTHREDVT